MTLESGEGGRGLRGEWVRSATPLADQDTVESDEACMCVTLGSLVGAVRYRLVLRLHPMQIKLYSDIACGNIACTPEGRLMH